MKKICILPIIIIFCMTCYGCAVTSSVATDAAAETRNETLPNLSSEENPRDPAPTIYIYHSHSSEKYKDFGSVVDVGKELVEYLRENYSLNVVHDASVYDTIVTSSYEESLKGINSAISNMSAEQTPNFYIDIHRDASPSASTITLDCKKTAKVLLVLGKGEDFEEHERPDFEKNYQFASQIYSCLNESATGIANPIIVKSAGRYNQHIGTSVLIEIGNDSDTYESAIATIPYIADAIFKSAEDIHKANSSANNQK